MTDVTALRNRGKEITLLDGRTAVVSFDLEAMAQIEEDFGSLGGWQDALNKIGTDQMNAQMMRPLIQMLRAGLSHDPSYADARFDPQLLEDYFKAVMGAAEQAFPQQAQGTTTNSPETAQSDVATTSSLGPTTTTPQPSSSVVPITSSGA